jgi:hypothetical protein
MIWRPFGSSISVERERKILFLTQNNQKGKKGRKRTREDDTRRDGRRDECPIN